MSEPAPVNPTALLWDISSLDDTAAKAEGERLYRMTFIRPRANCGDLVAHDGVVVRFFADRFHHAFHSSSNRARHAYAKDKVARERLERMAWIRPILEGKMSQIECWEVPLKVPEEGIRCFPGKRLYASWNLGYVIWLEPLRAGGFKFSTAYPAPPAEIGRYIERARMIYGPDRDYRA
jgi:hypothetical protein